MYSVDGKLARSTKIKNIEERHKLAASLKAKQNKVVKENQKSVKFKLKR